MKNRLFLNTSYLIALLVKRDQLHSRAVRLSQEIEVDNDRFLTTRGVLLEVGNSLATIKHRQNSERLLRQLEDDPRTAIAEITQDFYLEGLDMFHERNDKTWGLVDCISFVVMKNEGVSTALTADEHFLHAGFRALLLED